ncbi:unnamed protein product [Prorocentrum cordatum]|uniref:Uncharacterized protein n=1 Tax=Prorocentrum cordatum TaxID=2364126 RepID=A0ABN9Q9A1_9DINO|nr:unnamed protein product [Polarella glacialis]
MDAALAFYFNDCLHRGVSSDRGAQVLASLAHVYLGLRSAWKVPWPRPARASATWKQRVPAGMRLPMPKAVAMAVCLLLVEAGPPWMAARAASLVPGKTGLHAERVWIDADRG